MASAQEHGTFRVVFDNANETNPKPPADFSTAIHSGGALAVPTGATLTAIPVVGKFPYAGQRMIVSFISAAADTVESEESDWEIPVLILNKAGAISGRKTIKMEAMTGFTSAGTVDVVCTADVAARLAYIDAPSGYAYMLDPNGKVRAYIGDDTA